MNKLKELFKKVFTKEVIFYGIFGILTTIVNLASFYILNDICKINENIANIIAIILAVLFAYFTNKDLVFHSNANTFKEKSKQFIKFISGRAVTMVIEFVGCALLFLTPIPEIVSKLFITVIVIILNFFISKFFAFKK
ncbi:MAG: GtrA family protein [Clostridia bacterium]|nr:GtrA family protein [Clostridia bacterium]